LTDARSVITYEYPLNERIRTLLRLEDLFERSRHFIARTDPHDHHMALLTLFEILEVSSRADLKSDLLQELERQKQVLLSFRNNPEIAEEALSGVLRDIEQASAALFSMTGKIGQYLRENDWLMSIKQRTGIPGGACEFDLPSLLAASAGGGAHRPARRLDRAALPAARRLGDHPAHPARIGAPAGSERAAGHVPADARRQDGADAAPAPGPLGGLRA
jgi:cell division FtsZ-interacting protein ZapD